MPQSWEGRHAEDFSDARKIQRLRPGLNPRTQVPESSMLTTRPPKPSRQGLQPVRNNDWILQNGARIQQVNSHNSYSQQDSIVRSL